MLMIKWIAGTYNLKIYHNIYRPHLKYHIPPLLIIDIDYVIPDVNLLKYIGVF